MSTQKTTNSEFYIMQLIQALDVCGVKKYGRNKKLAEITGYSENYISGVFNKKEVMTEKFLKGIFKHFNISEDWFISGEGEMFISREQVIPEIVSATSNHLTIGTSKDPLIHEMLALAEQAMERSVIPLEDRRRLALKFLEEVEGFCRGKNGERTAADESRKRKQSSTEKTTL